MQWAGVITGVADSITVVDGGNAAFSDVAPPGLDGSSGTISCLSNEESGALLATVFLQHPRSTVADIG